MQNRSFAPWPLFVLYTHQNCERVNELGRLLLLLSRMPQEGPKKEGKGNLVYWKIYHFHFQAINSVFWAQCDKGQMCSGDLPGCPKRETRASSSVVRRRRMCLCRSAGWAHWNSSGCEKCGIYLPGRIPWHSMDDERVICSVNKVIIWSLDDMYSKSGYLSAFGQCRGGRENGKEGQGHWVY